MEASTDNPRTMGSLDILTNAMTVTEPDSEGSNEVESSMLGKLSSRSIDTTDKSRPTREHLESLTLGIIEGFNTRQFDNHPSYAYFSPHWRAQSTDQAIFYPLDQHFEISRRMTADNPDLWIRVVGTNVVMGYRDLCADVYVDMEHHGYPLGLVRTCIGVFHWKVFDDEDGKKKWLCTRHTGARGITGIEPLRECDALDDSVGWWG